MNSIYTSVDHTNKWFRSQHVIVTAPIRAIVTGWFPLSDWFTSGDYITDAARPISNRSPPQQRQSADCQTVALYFLRVTVTFDANLWRKLSVCIYCYFYIWLGSREHTLWSWSLIIWSRMLAIARASFTQELSYLHTIHPHPHWLYCCEVGSAIILEWTDGRSIEKSSHTLVITHLCM